jgi:hypothetical protein
VGVGRAQDELLVSKLPTEEKNGNQKGGWGRERERERDQHTFCRIRSFAAISAKRELSTIPSKMTGRLSRYSPSNSCSETGSLLLSMLQKGEERDLPRGARLSSGRFEGSQRRRKGRGA